MAFSYGIDFSTSNSCVGICDAEGPHLLPIHNGATSVPTDLFFSFDDDSTPFGHEALERYFARVTGRYSRAIKRLLSTTFFDEPTQFKRKRYIFGEIIAAFLWFLRPAAGKNLTRRSPKKSVGASPKRTVFMIQS